MIDWGLVMVAVVVLGFVLFILPKPVRKSQAPGGVGLILPDGSILYQGKRMTVTEARRLGLRLEFATERKQAEYKPKAWR